MDYFFGIEEESGVLFGVLGLLELSSVLLLLLVPPGAPAPPVAEPGCMPKCENIRCRQSDWATSGQLLRSKDGALSSLLLSPLKVNEGCSLLLEDVEGVVLELLL